MKRATKMEKTYDKCIAVLHGDLLDLAELLKVLTQVVFVRAAGKPSDVDLRVFLRGHFF